mmetsp:Transcript_27176/g.61416  ORF Transcript_27176/g.61416 Transcript_27176/m.61416 type:complete len:132 (+) Transcript_27176:1276-1671(+)
MREYEENVRKAFGTSEVAAFRKYFSVAKVKAPKIFVITFAPAPVGCYDTHCPPLRWYSFQAVEALNNMARTAARKSGLGIIDVASLAAPLWDSSPDWNHPDEMLKHAACSHIVRAAMGTVEDNIVLQPRTW